MTRNPNSSPHWSFYPQPWRPAGSLCNIKGTNDWTNVQTVLPVARVPSESQKPGEPTGCVGFLHPKVDFAWELINRSSHLRALAPRAAERDSWGRQAERASSCWPLWLRAHQAARPPHTPWLHVFFQLATGVLSGPAHQSCQALTGRPINQARRGQGLPSPQSELEMPALWSGRPLDTGGRGELCGFCQRVCPLCASITASVRESPLLWLFIRT